VQEEKSRRPNFDIMYTLVCVPIYIYIYTYIHTYRIYTFINKYIDLYWGRIIVFTDTEVHDQESLKTTDTDNTGNMCHHALLPLPTMWLSVCNNSQLSLSQVDGCKIH
jgi:hypothetical protein